jgi:SAM-dependent methyltransferase
MQTGLPDASFDLVISNHVLEHVSDDVASLREQLRIVGELGIVHCCVPAPVFLWETTEWDFPDPKKNGHYREYGADFAMRMIVRAGPCHSIAIAANDPITNMPDLIYLFSKSNERLAQFAGAIRSHHFAITRVA